MEWTMTRTVNQPTLSPLIVGQAEKAHAPLLDCILAGTGTTRHQWMTLTLAATAGGSITRDQLVDRITGTLKIDVAAATAIITELIWEHLLADSGAGVELTDPGQKRYREIRAAVDEVTARVYGDIPADDLATAARVLTQITARLNAEIA
jgi:DNA-binding MarR family transcriptional regulator